MKVTVLKPFPCANALGKDLELIGVGEAEIRDELVPGLVAEGYLAQPEHLPPVPMSHGRRKGMIEALLEEGRRQMEAASDEQLWSAFEHLQASLRPAEPDPQAQLQLEPSIETKVDAPSETGAPQPLDVKPEGEGEPKPEAPAPAKSSRRAK